MSNENIDISQWMIRKKLVLYLRKLKIFDTENKYDNDEFINDLEDEKKGDCSGLTSCWLYGKMVEAEAQQTDKPRDDSKWFFETQILLSKWNGSFLNLTKNQKENIDHFISVVHSFQEPEKYYSSSQEELENFVEDTKNRKFYKCNSVGTLFNIDTLVKKLQIIPHGRGVKISSHNHSVGLYKKNNQYFCYNSNNPNANKREFVSNDIKKIAAWILDEFHFYQNSYSPLGLTEFSFRKPQEEDIVSIYKFLENIKPPLEIQNSNQNDYADGLNALLIAASSSSLESVKYCLAHGANVHQIDNNGYTPLHYAAIKGNIEIIKLLLKNGANIDAKTHKGDTALHFLTRFGGIENIEFLLRMGANIDAKNNDGVTALHCVARNESINIVELLLNSNVLVDVESNMGMTPLYYAATSGNIKILERLVEYGASLTKKSSTNFNILHQACFYGKIEFADYLLRKYPYHFDVNFKDNRGRTALYCACEKNQLGTVKFLIEKGAIIDENIFKLATKHNNNALIVRLVIGKLLNFKSELDKNNVQFQSKAVFFNTEQNKKTAVGALIGALEKFEKFNEYTDLRKYAEVFKQRELGEIINYLPDKLAEYMGIFEPILNTAQVLWGVTR